MSSISKFIYSEKLLIVLILLAYIFFQIPFMHLDLWNDEIYTLKYFTFVSPLQTVTDYHVPNNHVLFNLVNNFYLKLTGERDVYSLMDHPWQLRIVSLAYSAGTVFFTYKCAEKISGRTAAVLSVIFLCTTLPFYNFAAAIRGYALSTFLVTALSYTIFRYIETRGRSLLLFIAGLTTAAVYTIPLNLYMVLSIVVFLFLATVCSLLLKGSAEKKIQRVDGLKKYIFIIMALISGILLALFFYAGIFREVFFNNYVLPDPGFNTATWLATTTQIFIYLFSYRYFIIPLILIGMYVNIFRSEMLRNKRKWFFFLYLFTLLLFPFVLAFMRREEPPDRAFINLIPFFAMMLAWMIHGLVALIPRHKPMILFEAGIAAYCFVILSLQMKAVSNHLLEDIRTSGRSHNIYYNYYLNHFHPLSVIRNFKTTSYNASSFVVIRDSEPYDLPEYLNKFSIPTHDFSLVDSALMTGKKVFLFTRYPNEIQNDAFPREHKCRVRLISEGISYHNLFELEHRNMP